MIHKFNSWLKTVSLRTKIISVYVMILAIGGLLTSYIGSLIVDKTLMNQAYDKVTQDLQTLKLIYDKDQARLTDSFTMFRMQYENIFNSSTPLASLNSVHPGQKGARVLETISHTMKHDLQFNFVGIIDQHGIIIYEDENHSVIGENITSFGMFANVFKDSAVATYQLIDNKLFMTENSKSLNSSLCHFCAYPFKNSHGELIGSFYGGKILNHNYELMDQTSQLIYKNDKTEGIIAITMGDNIIASNKMKGTEKRLSNERLPADIFKSLLNQTNMKMLDIYLFNKKYLAASAPIHNYEGHSVGLFLTAIPEQIYISIRNQLMSLFLGVAAIGLFLIALISYIITNHITKPLGNMVKITQSIANGNLEQEFVVDSNDEIGLLGSSLNKMVESLKNMRSELEDWGKTLEQKVNERTNELQNIQNKIMQTDRLASIGQLAAGVAHEINNPLGGILVLSSLTIENISENDPNRNNLEEIVKQTIRCRDIVKSLLEFSRQADAKLSKVNIISVLDYTISLLENQNVFNQIKLKKIYQKDIPRVEVDESQFQQVFMNIILNAIQAMNNVGMMELVVSYNDQLQRIVISIEDNGSGISKDIIDKIFDPFFSTKQVGEGTGLGLSIAYGIVTRHNGKMYVSSEEGVGSVFTVELPVIKLTESDESSKEVS